MQGQLKNYQPCVHKSFISVRYNVPKLKILKA